MSEWTIREGYKYAKTDEWIRAEGSEAVIGISDYAQNQLSDLVFIELPKVGAVFEAGQSFGVVESVKAAADLIMPVKGEVLAVNSGVESSPELMNKEPYDSGWIIRINVAQPQELDSLMDAQTYKSYCDQRG